MRVRDAINRMIDSSRWHFQTNQEELDLGEPYQKLGSKTFRYWQTHPIQIDCLIILNLLLLFYLRDELEELGIGLETMRPAMKIDVSCGLIQTGLHHLTPLVPLGDLDHQREVVRRLGPGAYLYIRGPHGWYDYVYRQFNQRPLDVDTVYQVRT
jgi:hypothetical protein